MELTTKKYTSRANYILLFGLLTLVLSFLFIYDIENEHRQQLERLSKSAVEVSGNPVNEVDVQHTHHGGRLWLTYSLLALLMISTFVYIYVSSIQTATKFSKIKHTLDLAPDAIISTNSAGIIDYANQAAFTLFELDQEDLGVLEVESLIPKDIRPIHRDYREEFQSIQRSVAMVDRKKSLRAQTKHGKEFPAGISLASYIIDGSKENIVIVKDMSKEEQLLLSANTDSLTGLPNRRRIEDLASASLARARRSEGALSIAIIDIDDFKNINDQYGHLKGDEVLVSFAMAVRKIIRSTDFIGRWGGEEFLLIMESTDQKGAQSICEKIRETIERSIRVDSIGISVSIGLVELNDHRQIIELVSDADQALYLAKNNGKNRVEVVNADKAAVHVINP